MALRELFGLDDVNITEAEIMARVKKAFDEGESVLTFTGRNGTKVTVRIPRLDFSRYSDPWDGKRAH